MMFDEFDEYSERMLMSQFEISKIIAHELSKGEVREQFLRTTLAECCKPAPYLVKGTVTDGNLDAGQLDIILCRPFYPIREFPSYALVPIEAALCVFEVKGNCTGQDLKEAEERAKRIRALPGNKDTQFGVICYQVELLERTLMKRFGYTYEAGTGTYFDSATYPHVPEADCETLHYPTLDFFVSLEENKKMFLRKYAVAPGKDRFARMTGYPLIKHVFEMTRSLWSNAHRAHPQSDAVAAGTH